MPTTKEKSKAQKLLRSTKSKRVDMHIKVERQMLIDLEEPFAVIEGLPLPENKKEVLRAELVVAWFDGDINGLKKKIEVIQNGSESPNEINIPSNITVEFDAADERKCAFIELALRKGYTSAIIDIDPETGRVTEKLSLNGDPAAIAKEIQRSDRARHM